MDTPPFGRVVVLTSLEGVPLEGVPLEDVSLEVEGVPPPAVGHGAKKVF